MSLNVTFESSRHTVCHLCKQCYTSTLFYHGYPPTITANIYKECSKLTTVTYICGMSVQVTITYIFDMTGLHKKEPDASIRLNPSMGYVVLCIMTINVNSIHVLVFTRNNTHTLNTL